MASKWKYKTFELYVYSKVKRNMNESRRVGTQGGPSSINNLMDTVLLNQLQYVR